MANHHLAPKGELVLIYRFNPFEDHWEFWAYDEDLWHKSAYHGGKDSEPPTSADFIVSFEDTWAEPYYEPEYD